jgi:hypothetical protein
LETKLAVLLKYLPELRAQGVLAIKVDGLEVALRPLAVEEPQKPAEEPPAGRDPVTYGLQPGTKMPTLRERSPWLK